MRFSKSSLKPKFFFLGIFAVISATSIHFAHAYVASDFSPTLDNDTVVVSDTMVPNILLGEFAGPTPATDAYITGGEGDITNGDTLSLFATSERFIDITGEGYIDGDPIVASADDTLDDSDVVITTGVSALTSFGGSEVGGMVGYLDVNDNDSRDSNEDLIKLVSNGEDATLAAGDAITLFPLADAESESSNIFFTENGDTNYDWTAPPAIFSYVNGGDHLQGQVIAVQPGGFGFVPIDSNDPLCTADLDSDNYYDLMSDIVWVDSAGTCTTFNSGVDIVIQNPTDAAFSGTNAKMSALDVPNEFGPLTLGYSDANADGIYSCARGGYCEAVLVPTGSWSYEAGHQASSGEIVFGLQGNMTNLTDGVSTIAEYWDEGTGAGNSYLMDRELIGGEQKYAFIDTNENSTFDDGEDVLEVTLALGAVNVTTSVKFRLLPSYAKFVDTNIDGSFEDGESLVVSVNSNLDAGPLDGGGTDLVVRNGNSTVSTFASNERYFDTNVGESYTDGEPIVTDTDDSGYFNADDLESIAFTNPVTDYPMGDDDVDALYLYKKVGGECGGDGTDTLLGSITDAPFFDAPITVTDSVFTSGVNYCVYADIAAAADAGDFASIAIAQNGATYASGTSPTDASLAFTTNMHVVEVVRDIDATIETDSEFTDDSATYTLTAHPIVDYLADDGLALMFPEGYNIDTASVSCHVGENPIGGATTLYQDAEKHMYAVFFHISDNVDGGSTLVCDFHVVNPPTEGECGDFVALFAHATDDFEDVGTERASMVESFTIVDAPPQSSHGSRGGGGGFVQPAMTITSPANHANVSGQVNLTWHDTGTAPHYANIVYYSGNNRYVVATGVPNEGAYSWIPPASLIGKEIKVTVELTDQSSVSASADVWLTIGAATPGLPTDQACSAYSIPDLSSRLYKSDRASTVYYLDSKNMLRPFFSEPLFFSWHLDFDHVKEVNHGWLSGYLLGAPMAPPSGTVLVKSPDSTRVWVMEPNSADPALPILHWIASEEVANAYFGTGWGARILDVAPSIVVMSPKGADLTDPASPPCYIQLYK